MYQSSTRDFLFDLSNIYKNQYKQYLCYSYNENINDVINDHYICYFNNDFDITNNVISGNNSKKVEYIISSNGSTRYISDSNVSLSTNDYLYYGNFGNLPQFEVLGRQYDIYFYTILVFLALLVFIPFVKNLLNMEG